MCGKRAGRRSSAQAQHLCNKTDLTPRLPGSPCCTLATPPPSARPPEPPLLREPPVSVPPGLKSSPSSVMHRVLTSRLNASFLAVPASCARSQLGEGQ